LIGFLILRETKFWQGTFGKADALPGFAARNDTVTAIGFSSGAFMATNLHTIYSRSFAGAGLVSGGPYSIGTLCEDGCIDYEGEEDEYSDWAISAAKDNEAAEKINLLENLEDSPVFIHSGSKDRFVSSSLQNATEKFYENFGANVTVNRNDFNHVWPTDISPDFKEEGDCTATPSPPDFVVNCGFDLAGATLSHLLPGIAGSRVTELKPKDADWKSKGTF